MSKYEGKTSMNQGTITRYTKKALLALSNTLKLHQQLVWVNPETNELSIKHLPAGSISAEQVEH